MNIFKTSSATTVLFTLALFGALLVGTANAAIGSTGGPVDCVIADGCPTTVLAESGTPVTDWPNFDLDTDELGPIADGYQCKLEVIYTCGPTRS